VAEKVGSQAWSRRRLLRPSTGCDCTLLPMLQTWSLPANTGSTPGMAATSPLRQGLPARV
jgi:hypothetical protein